MDLFLFNLPLPSDTVGHSCLHFMGGGTELRQANNIFKVIHPESNRASISIQSSNHELGVFITVRKMFSIFTLHRVHGRGKVGKQCIKNFSEGLPWQSIG